MRLAFAIASLFVSGGLQRDCLTLAEQAVERGHSVTLFTADLRDPVDSPATVTVLATGAVTNPGRDRRLGEQIAAMRERFDRVVGFNKMPGLDVLYCADPPFHDMKGPLSRIGPRYRAQIDLEASCFAPSAQTALVLLSPVQATAYVSAWQTPADRIEVLPPTLDAHRRRPGLRTETAARARLRAGLGVGPTTQLWLSIAAVPEVKGVDRTVAALRDHENAVLVVAGPQPAARGGQLLTRLARQAGVESRLRLLGHREDIPELMAAADLLVHPARRDTTGTVILEAIANGLPAIVSAACGYAQHVERSGAGLVCPEPFDPVTFATALRTARDPARRASWSQAGRHYGADPELTSGHARAVDLITGPLWGLRQPDRGAAGTQHAWAP